MVLPTMAILRTTYGSKVPNRVKQKFKGHQDEWRYIQESMLRLGCSTGDQYIFESENYAEQVPPFACSFSRMANSSHLLAVVDEDGFVTLFDTRRSTEVVKVFRAHKNAVFDVAWAEGKNQLVTASGDQMAALWDVVTGKALAVFKGHSCSLKSVCFRPRDCHVFATGARDGNILVWDTRCNNRGGSQVSHHTAVNIIKEAHAEASTLRSTPSRKRSRLISSMPMRGDSLSSITVVNFQDDMSLFSAGATDRTIKVWDLRKCNKGMKRAPIPRQVYPYTGTSIKNGGFSSLIFNSTRSEIFASCTDDIIYRYSTLSSQTQPIATYSGHRNSSFYIKSALSHNDGLLLSGSGDGKAYIWNVNQPQDAPITLCGHDDEVTMVAWAEDDFPKLVTGADDSSIRIWRLGKDKDTCRQSMNELIGQAERSACNNLMKENLPPFVKNAIPPTGHSTPPRQTGNTSHKQEAKKVQASTPTTPRPQTRRTSSIADWLKNSPQTASKETGNSLHISDSPSPSNKVQGSPPKKTQEERPTALTPHINQDNCDQEPTQTCLEQITSEQLKQNGGMQSVFKTTLYTNRSADGQLQANTRQTEASISHSLKCRRQTPQSPAHQSQVSSVQLQTMKSSPVAEVKIDSQLNQSPLACRKRKRRESPEDVPTDKSANASQDLFRLGDGNSPDPVKRNKRLNFELSKVREGRTVGRGRSSLTSHAQHQLCTCSCSGNHRHSTGNSTANNGTNVAGQITEHSDSPETGLESETPKTGCSGSTRNICFYFQPHSREAKQALLDNTKMKNGPLSKAIAEQINQY